MTIDDAARLAAPLFLANLWAYGDSNGNQVPDALQIARVLDMLVANVRDNPDTTYARTGRFRVQRDTHEDEPDTITVLIELGEV